MTTAGMVTMPRRRRKDVRCHIYGRARDGSCKDAHRNTVGRAWGGGNPDQIARDVLIEIVNAARPSK